MICFDQRSKKREVDNLSSGWLWIAEPKVIVRLCWRHQYLAKSNILQYQYLATPIFGKIPENSAKGLDASLGPWPRPFI